MIFDDVVEQLHPVLKQNPDCRFVALCLHSVIKGLERSGRFAGRETILEHLHAAHDSIPDTGPMSDDLEQEQATLHPQLKAHPVDGATAVSLMLDSVIRSPRSKQYREELHEAKQHVGQAIDLLEAAAPRTNPHARRNPPLWQHMEEDDLAMIAHHLGPRLEADPSEGAEFALEIVQLCLDGLTAKKPIGEYDPATGFEHHLDEARKHLWQAARGAHPRQRHNSVRRRR